MNATAGSSGRRGNFVRTLGWATLAALLAVPALAMRFAPGAGFNWTAADFVAAAVLLGGVGTGLELAVRMSRDWAYRAGAALAVGTGSLLLWANLAVGLVGDEGNAANRLFVGVLVIAAVGAMLARLRPGGLARTLAATAFAQLAAAAVALGITPADPGRPVEIAALAGVFPALWLVSAWLFRRAAYSTNESSGLKTR
jgi:hypothetical protein